MTGELYFYRGDWEDAWDEYGVNMGSGFIDALLAPAPMKSFIESDCRLEDGKRVISAYAYQDSRDVTLSFTVLGDDKEDDDDEDNEGKDCLSRLAAFYALLHKGELVLKVPTLGDDVYHLVYKKSSSFSHGTSRRVCTVSVKFTEPDPSNREL